jgi:hypothetical protein
MAGAAVSLTNDVAVNQLTLAFAATPAAWFTVS